MKKYNVIYADPPWCQSAGNGFNYQTNDKKMPYQTMSIADICNLNVKDIAAKDAHLYIWVTNQYLPKAFEVIKAWGFKYSTTIIWEKALMGGGLGGSFVINHELLLFCRRGKLKSLKRIKGTVHKVKRPYVNGKPAHSKKPEYFAEMIEKVSPGNKLEMFARSERNGWDVFGNQVANSIIIPTLAQ
jgi:N6-adenosine-specific RNA methylase IME4